MSKKLVQRKVLDVVRTSTVGAAGANAPRALHHFRAQGASNPDKRYMMVHEAAWLREGLGT
jgi:hypothetical protein